MSLLRNSDNYRFLLKFKWYFSLKKIHFIVHPNLIWSGVEQLHILRVGSPSKSLHFSGSHLAALHTEVPCLAPLPGPDAGPVLVLTRSCWSASGTSTIPCSLCPARWPRGPRDCSQPRSISQGIASPYAQRKPRALPIAMAPWTGKGKEAWSKDAGILMSPLSFSRLYFSQGGVQVTALESKGSKQFRRLLSQDCSAGWTLKLDILIETLGKWSQDWKPFPEWFGGLS